MLLLEYSRYHGTSRRFLAWYSLKLP